MGQNSSVAVGTSKLAPDKGDIIVDASDSCVSGVKLRSTGIIPISELIKQEKCSKNIQKIEQSYYNRKKAEPNKDDTKSKTGKPEFIETSFEDVPARRQWVRVDSEPKKPFESDALKIGLKKPSKAVTDKPISAQNNSREHKERKREHNRDNSRHTKRETIREDVRENVRPPTRKGIRKNVGTGTQDYNKGDIPRKSKITEKKNIITEQSKKSILKNIVTEHKFKESSTQTITEEEKPTTYENVKQLYKRNNSDERKRNRSKYQEGNKVKQQYQPQQPKQYKQHNNKKEKIYKDRDREEESTHQFKTHDISHPKRRSRKRNDKFRIQTMLSCSIPPEKYLQWQCSNDNHQLGRRAGRNYLNRKLAGEYYSSKEKYMPYNNEINSYNSCEMIQPSISLLPSASTLEQAIKEHRKYVSAKEALESWKNLHTWKQHRKRYERSRNEFHQDNFDVATQTMSHSPQNILVCNSTNIRSNHYMQTHPDSAIVPSEKHLYKDFIVKMEHCLQKHSRLCELNVKRRGEGNFTWVQDKYRRWHKITFDEFKN